MNLLAAPEMARVRFASSGSEANETALRLARAYHVDRGERDRWRVISPAQAYHGSTMATLALTGRRRTLQEPFEPYLSPHLHVGHGERMLNELDSRLEEQPFLTGREYGLADIAYVPWIVRGHELLGLDLDPFPSVRRWLERLQERPAVAAETAVVAALTAS